jgi:hypothetical protein
MPYVPSEKTDGKSQDRNILDKEVEVLSQSIADRIINNGDLCIVYKTTFIDITSSILNGTSHRFADKVLEIGEKYKYEGAFLGELNYAITRIIQRVPQLLALQNKCGLTKGKELRYWLYAMTVDSLILTANHLIERYNDTKGIAGVFEDIKDEYKVRVNKSYEIAQILKSGDCYDTPYLNKVVEIVDETGKNVGYTYVEIVNDGENYKKDKLNFKIIVKSN